jgi:hypothetical protein
MSCKLKRGNKRGGYSFDEAGYHHHEEEKNE